MKRFQVKNVILWKFKVENIILKSSMSFLWFQLGWWLMAFVFKMGSGLIGLICWVWVDFEVGRRFGLRGLEALRVGLELWIGFRLGFYITINPSCSLSILLAVSFGVWVLNYRSSLSYSKNLIPTQSQLSTSR